MTAEAIGHVPYGAYWSTPFARWQGRLSHLNATEFCARVARDRLGAMGVAAGDLDLCHFGQTVMQPGSFYAAPWFAAMIGAERLAAPKVDQACATGARLVAGALGEMAVMGGEVALVASGDRTSNGPHVYYPAPHGPGGTGVAEDWVIGSFGRDPWAGGAMVDTAENVAAREGIDTAEQHDLVAHRAAQYAGALADDRAFQRRYMPLPLAVPDARGREGGASMEGDEGVEAVDPAKMARLRPVREGGTVTFAGQTHPADGNAGMVLTRTAARAAAIAPDGAPPVAVVAVGQARAEKGFMPAAPIGAARRALEAAGIAIGAVDVVKSHNPFAVNDIAFARAFGIDWRGMNPFGCSLIWGHPQGPTGLRSMIEMVEALAARGGGTGLFQGCAAGDSAMAVLVRVG